MLVKLEPEGLDLSLQEYFLTNVLYFFNLLIPIVLRIS